MMDRVRKQASAKGALTALNSAVAIDLRDANFCIFSIAATAVTATVVLEVSLDSTNGVDGTWFTMAFSPANSTNLYTQVASVALTAAPTTTYSARTAGYRFARARVSAWTSGTAVSLILSAFSGPY